MAPGPRTRLGNLRFSPAPRPLGGGPRAPGAAQVPSAIFQTRGEEGRAGRGSRGLARGRRGPAELHAADSRSLGVLRPGPDPPRASTTPEPLSGSALRPPGPAAPPARPALSVHAQGPPRCPERAPPAGDSTCRRAQSGPDPQAVPGGAQGTGRRERRARQRASQPASQLASQPSVLYWTDNLAQWVKALAAKPKAPCLILGAHVEEENQLP